MHYQLWIGQEGRFCDEVKAAISLLTGPVLAGKAGVLFSPQPREGFDWIGEREWRQHASGIVDKGAIGLQTSGTTGEPKWMYKRLENILADKKGRGSAKDCWLLCYSPARWAGLSVVAHAIRHSARIIAPDNLEPRAIAQAMLASTHVSLTPSMFRKILLHCADGVCSIPLEQVTFGGEYATQKTLDDARSLWPQARITHIYASTELGDLWAVSDGLEGLPQCKAAGCQLSSEGELIVNGHRTGDLWTWRGDRLIFIGRRDDMVNVGGAKIAPSVVEAACMSVPEVRECRAYGVRNALLGEVVALDYSGSIDPGSLRALLAGLLPKPAVPAKLTRMDEIPVSPAGKTLRKSIA